MASKVEGYVLNLGGAPAGWHMVAGLGYFHPDIPVTAEGARAYLDALKEQAAEAEKAHDAHEAEQEARGNRQNWRQAFVQPDPPIRAVRVSEKELADGDAARAAHMAGSRAAIRTARRSGSDDEQVQAHEEAAALAAAEAGGQE